MSNHKTYTQALAKLAALVEQQKSVTANLHSNAQAQQAAQQHLHEASERAESLRGKVVRGIASDEEQAEADILSEKLLAHETLEKLQSNEKVCRDELHKLDGELSGARAAVTAALQKLCCGIADQLGDTLKKDKKLRTAMVDIYAACHAMVDHSLGGSFGGTVAWDAVLADIFPEPDGNEFDAAYERFKSELAK